MAVVNARMVWPRALLCVVLSSPLAACVSVPGQPVADPVELSAGTEVRFIEIQQDQDVSVSTFYRRTIKKGTRWQLRGRVPAGDVFRPVNTVFTVESSHVHEAYLVISGQSLVGYYLPVEKRFSEITPSAVQLQMSDVQQ